MAKNKTPPPPTQEQVDKHWKGQDKSVFQKPYTRDPGVTIATTQGEITRLHDAAKDGETAPAFKLRNTEVILEDPVGRPMVRSAFLVLMLPGCILIMASCVVPRSAVRRSII
ncbi:hypothetical protein [Novosphingobium guangzhouense]|uniref:hypothetical protein n=1 Tax=Novosphingobium guangzhouense TaxID=1850347 RepID=UPI0011AEE073|nr:hypothetical protein [Novosphingobium guangzhouense]